MVDKNYKDIGTSETKAIEECSELIHALCKVDRFGWFDRHPKTKILNIDWVTSEVEDLRLALDNLEEKIRVVWGLKKNK